MGTIALLGYAVDLSPAYAWGGFREMALLTASLFIVLRVGIAHAVHGLSGARRWQDLPWLATSIGVGLGALTTLGWNALRSRPPEMAPPWVALPNVLFILGLILSAVLAGFVAQRCPPEAACGQARNGQPHAATLLGGGTRSVQPCTSRWAMYQAKRSGRNRVQVDKASAAHH